MFAEKKRRVHVSYFQIVEVPARFVHRKNFSVRVPTDS
ncbi:hypothetical protein LEP1GSC145_1549 [Leptospira interrogans serovar Djasiman str. LT1649]|nr:hypothetical protein LEP1GSC148_4436 [Leptospira interrogans serovar Canicola str. LT1962]EMM92181.1 hypothetical protein LEP1GSC145_1549 [Leptospira interrogans serovar Djasiman str. LT1649]EMN78582.1 hypothetical protein LEP1GSC106_2962 [Leptospira interrogans serovar Grippotyphosa str. UI 12764]